MASCWASVSSWKVPGEHGNETGLAQHTAASLPKLKQDPHGFATAHLYGLPLLPAFLLRVQEVILKWVCHLYYSFKKRTLG